MYTPISYIPPPSSLRQSYGNLIYNNAIKNKKYKRNSMIDNVPASAAMEMYNPP